MSRPNETMTIFHKLPRSVPGSALIMSLMTTAIIGLLLASYLSLIQTQNVSVTRSQAWNVSIAVAEGGVEEALAQLNPGIKPWDTNATLDLGANGWTADADGNYRPQQGRYLGSNYYDVVIAPGTSPVISSTGYTATPFGCAPISRTIQVTTTNAQLTVLAMGAQGNIDFKGFNVETDSYDSTTDSASTDGRYDAGKARDHGDVTSNSGLV